MNVHCLVMSALVVGCSGALVTPDPGSTPSSDSETPSAQPTAQGSSTPALNPGTDGSSTPIPGTPNVPSTSAPTGGMFTPGLTGPVGSCADAYAPLVFTNAITTWTTISLSPSAGTAGLRDAILDARDSHAAEPVRILLAPGLYAPADESVGEMWLEDLTRTAAAPLLIEASDKTPNATRIGMGFNLVNASYVAFDGLTIGPAALGAFSHPGLDCDALAHVQSAHALPHALNAQAAIHVAGVAINPTAAGQVSGHLNFSVYGRYAPSHHILVRRVTIQNIHDNGEPSGAGACGAGNDGIKFNQAADVLVLDSSVRQTSRHGIDNVGVHRGVFCNNNISDVGQGLGIEAKGGSTDIVFDANIFVNVRRVEIGGEMTDATYYWSEEAPGSVEHYAYEARRLIARNNIVIDPRETAFELSGCHDCAIVANTVLYRAGANTDGDVLREVNSYINSGGAGSECGDIEQCWNVGSHPADLVSQVETDTSPGVSRLLGNARNHMSGNLFITVDERWTGTNPFNRPHSFDEQSLVANVDYNYWWNAGVAMTADEGWLAEGPHSVYTGVAAAHPALLSLAPVTTDPLLLRTRVIAALKPSAQSPVVGRVTTPAVSYDAALSPRPASASFGALEP